MSQRETPPPVPSLRWWPTCDEVCSAFAGRPEADVSASTIIITGGNSGVGAEAALALARLGAKVVVGARDEAKFAALAARAPAGSVHFLPLDLASFASVRSFADAFRELSGRSNLPPLDALILNAGIFRAGAGELAFAPGTTVELTFAVNHLGHHYLSSLLLPELRASAGIRPARGARVVVVSSQSHHGPLALYSPESRQGWVEQVAHCTAGYGMMGGINAYGSSKLANVLFADKLDRRERAHGVRACSLHPGSIIATDIARSANWVFRKAFDFASLFTKSADQGAATTVFCALAPPSQIGGVYFDCCRPGWKTWRATEAAEDVLWEVSETLVEANGGERQGP